MAKANVKKKVKPDRRTKAELIEALGAREEEVSIAQGETSRLQVALERATNKILQFSEQLAEKQKHLDGVREEARRTRNIAETLVSLIALENKPKVLKAKIAEALRRQRQELADYKDQVRWIVAAGYDQALSRDSEWPAGTDGSGAISFFDFLREAVLDKAEGTTIPLDRVAAILEQLRKDFPQPTGAHPRGAGHAAQGV